MKKSLCITLALILTTTFSQTPPLKAATKYSTNPDECVDGVCFVPQYTDDGRENYAIVSPVGYHDVPMIKMAKRLDTLAGKRIALVGGSFMATTTHNELKKCIEKEFPNTKLYLFDEVGAAGPFSVFGQTEKTKAFQARLKELNIDAVIAGNCGCGLCTTKESGNAIAAEYIGIPSVTVAAPTFAAQVHSTGVNRGVPVLRTAEYPGAFASHSTEELKRNAREVLYPAIKAALTSPITAAEIAQYAPEGKRPADEIIYYGNYDEIQEFFRINDWTDGLPIVPPTDEAIQEYLRFTPYKATDVLGTFALAYRECTVYTVAANAVMAGVPKEFLPICIAFVAGMNDGEWRKPLALRAYAHYWANTGSQQFKRRSFDEHYDLLSKDETEQAAMTATPEWLKPIVKSDEIMTIATMNKGDTAILVTGDANRNKFQVMPGGGFVTTEIKLPKDWNALVAPLGYAPIEEFYLTAHFSADNDTSTSAPKSKKQPKQPKKPKQPPKK